MKDNWLLTSDTARSLYRRVKDLPSADYHCHLSPKEIFENYLFDNIGEIWLGHDHYKWHLMREYGIDEKYITGASTWKEKFEAYAAAIATAAGNPLYHWTQAELERYFGITKPLNPDTANEIWVTANLKIKSEDMSPRSLIINSNVRALATTDDILDSLSYHEKIAADTSFPVKVLPTFRCDRLLDMQAEGYPAYLRELSFVSGISIRDLDSFKAAVIARMDYFVAHGCRFSDIGTKLFPNRVADDAEAALSFSKCMKGETLSHETLHGLIGYIYVFLAIEYYKRSMTMQWHLASLRNVNSSIYRLLGPDSGADCMSSLIPVEDILRLLDAIQESGGIPRTVLYTLNPTQNAAFSVIAGCFPQVICGTAWWVCDHKDGIEEVIRTVASTAHLGTFLGMLTDSRSFLSYARHDYFRRIFCSVIGKWIDGSEFPNDQYTDKLLTDVCYHNAAALFE